MELTIEEVFNAYFDCRKTKRYSSSALSFESNYEENLVHLYKDLKNRTWKCGKSTCFIVTKPVRREIFAAPFCDRIVHHILINRINPCFEKYFIRDSFACRKKKGTFYAIKRLEHFIKSETSNGKTQAYVLKLDIKGFFMNIDKKLLYAKFSSFLNEKYLPLVQDNDISFEKYLLKEIIFNDPSKNCVRRSPLCEWNKLPLDKSLFTAKENCGLPIGNLTSQIFANFYLSEFDHFAKHTLGLKCYVRYVDDFVIVHKDKRFLRKLIPVFRKFLKDELHLCLHPKKIYLQPCSNGVQFLGTFIKPSHTVCSRRVKNNFAESLKNYARLAENHRPTKKEREHFLSSVNSYLGIMRHYKTYKFRVVQILMYCKKYWSKFFTFKKPALKMEKVFYYQIPTQ